MHDLQSGEHEQESVVLGCCETCDLQGLMGNVGADITLHMAMITFKSVWKL